MLEPAVRWASRAGLYVIIDWHVIGDIGTGTSPNTDDVRAGLDETIIVWQQLAKFFAAAPNTLFELVNEPAGVTADEWRQEAQSLVSTVRATGSTAVVIIGGTDWSRDLSWATADPLTGANIAYATHIYPSHAASGWATWFGDLAATRPVLLTEWGFAAAAAAPDDSYLVGDVATYAGPLLDYVETLGMGWVACWYDDAWQPPLFGPARAPTAWGTFVFDALARERH
ncbi:MAG: glycoside hydrolase family 5 protein [Propionibacteriaceae bacterium]|nr:glycoside hydrolase family 5 protein [Propionibacteriaceae bacterium]